MKITHALTLGPKFVTDGYTEGPIKTEAMGYQSCDTSNDTDVKLSGFKKITDANLCITFLGIIPPQY